MKHNFSSHVNQENPYLQDIYAPVSEESTHRNLKVTGKIPEDISGVYVRNGPNPRFTPKGRYHWFDGDGMLHGLYLQGGKASYKNRWIRTSGFRMEEKERKSLWSGLIEPDFSHPVSPLKDSSNTDVILHQGEILTSWYRCGAVYRADPVTLETLGTASFQKQLKAPVSAHVRSDPASEELIIFNYGMKPPYINYGVIGRDGQLKSWIPVDVPGPRFPHDLAISKNYSVLFDFPVILHPEAMKAGKWQMHFDRETPSRYGIIPRHGEAADMRWFEGTPGYVYHIINTWEEGPFVMMTGCFVSEPVPPRGSESSELERMIKNLQLDARFWKWEFNLESGELRETQLDDLNVEFPVMNQSFLTRQSRYSWHMKIQGARTLLFEGLAGYDTVSGIRILHHFPKGTGGSEAAFIPADNASEENDGYLITFVTEMGSLNSEAHLFSAKDIESGPLAKIHIPVTVPLGFHACWAGLSGQKWEL